MTFLMLLLEEVCTTYRDGSFCETRNCDQYFAEICVVFNIIQSLQIFTNNVRSDNIEQRSGASVVERHKFNNKIHRFFIYCSGLLLLILA